MIIKPLCSCKGVYTLMIFGIATIATGCFVLVAQPYDFIFRLKCLFTDGGEIFELWRRPPVELLLKVYLFNVTNREAFMAGREKLKVVEVGPYVYREKMEHTNVSFNTNGTLTTTPVHPLKWVAELSNGTEDDKLILPNIALLSFANVMSTRSYFTQLGVNLLIRQTDSQPLEEMTAKEFMFGYKTTLVTLGNKFMPSWIMFDKLGLIDRMYDFNGDIETIYTGEKNLGKTGLIATYNRSPKLPQWEGKCGDVEGSSDGTKFNAFIKPNDTLLFFRKSLCRAVPLVRTSMNDTYRAGLRGYEYTFYENSLDNGEFNHDNKCFCRKGRCLPRGLLDVADCYYGFPIALSMPHYYNSDPKLQQLVDGNEPDEKKHKTYFIIQPESGLPLELAVRMQINMALNDVTPIARVGKFKNMVIPLLWTEIGMYGLPTSLNNRFLLYINILPTVQEVMIYLLFIGGVILMICAIKRLLTSNNDSGAETGKIKNNFFKSQNMNEVYEKEKYKNDTKSPKMISKDVLSDIIDEGKQAILGRNKKQYVTKDGVYKETCRRRSSIRNFFGLISNKNENNSKLKKQRTKEELYDVKVSKADNNFLKLFKETSKESTPLTQEDRQLKQSDSETESSFSANSDCVDKTPVKQEKSATTTSGDEERDGTNNIQEQNKDQISTRLSEISNKDDMFTFEVDVSMLDKIKEEIV